jgi:hypothetical protein
MITLDILEQRLLPSSHFDACLVCLFSIITKSIFICPIKTLRWGEPHGERVGVKLKNYKLY